MIVNLRVEAPDGERLNDLVSSMESRVSEHGCKILSWRMEPTITSSEEVGTPEARNG